MGQGQMGACILEAYSPVVVVALMPFQRPQAFLQGLQELTYQRPLHMDQLLILGLNLQEIPCQQHQRKVFWQKALQVAQAEVQHHVLALELLIVAEMVAHLFYKHQPQTNNVAAVAAVLQQIVLLEAMEVLHQQRRQHLQMEVVVAVAVLEQVLQMEVHQLLPEQVAQQEVTVH